MLLNRIFVTLLVITFHPSLGRTGSILKIHSPNVMPSAVSLYTAWGECVHVGRVHYDLWVYHTYAPIILDAFCRDKTAPGVKERQVCYSARDAFYQCLLEHHEEEAPCIGLKQTYQGSCLPSWVSE